MEILIVVAIWTVVVKRGIEDVLHVARGNTPPRYAAAKARRSSGAAGRYWGALWDDTWTDLLQKHTAKRARRDVHAPSPERPDQMRTVIADAWDDLSRYGRATWRHGWDKLARKQQDRRLRRSAGQQTVPGEVVPNQDEDQDGPEDGPRGRPQDEEQDGIQDEDGTADRDEREDEEPPPCPKCGTTMTTALNIGDPMSYDGKGIFRCPCCDYKIRRSPETTDDATQEGPTTMTATAVDGIGLDPQIRFCEESEQQFVANAQSNDNDLAISKKFADAYRQQVAVTDSAIAGVPQGVAVAAVAAMHAAMDKATAAATDMEQISALYAQAMDKANSAAADMATAAKEFMSYKNLQEGYAAQPDAPDKEFLLTGS